MCCISLLYFQQRSSKFMAQSAFDGQLAKRVASYLHEKRSLSETIEINKKERKTKHKKIASCLQEKKSLRKTMKRKIKKVSSYLHDTRS